MASRAYFDTSVLVKRYRNEPGAGAARGLLRRHSVVSSVLAAVELASTLYRQHGEGELDANALDAILARIRDDRQGWELVEVAPTVVARAEELVGQVMVRTLDALHLASAVQFWESTGTRLPFVTADARQRDAATRLGLAVTFVR